MVGKNWAWLAVALSCALSQPANAACVLSKIAEMPVTMRGLRPTVVTKINGREAVFVVDTGAQISMVSDAAVAQFGMTWAPAPPGTRVRGVGSGDAVAKFVRADEFNLAGARLSGVAFLVGARAGYGGAAGLLGQDYLGSFDMEYDFANGYVRFFESKGCADANPAYWSAGKPVSRVRLKDPGSELLPAIRTNAKVNGTVIGVKWDSGAGLSTLSLPAAARAGVRPTSPNVVSGGVAYGLFGAGIETSIAPFGSFAIGDEEIRNTQLRVADMELTEGHMLLGADFFLSHRILVSRTQRQVFFTHNGGPVFKLDQSPTQAVDGATEARAEPDAGAKP